MIRAEGGLPASPSLFTLDRTAGRIRARRRCNDLK